MPTSSRPTHFLQSIRRGRWAGSHGSAVTEGFFSRTPCAHKCLRRGTFCHQRQKVPKERRQNRWFWNPCAGVVLAGTKPTYPANRTDEIPHRAFASSLRPSPCISAYALALACRNYNLRCTPCPFVGGDALIAPPDNDRTSCRLPQGPMPTSARLQALPVTCH